MSKLEEVKKTSEDWQGLCKVQVLDPDGWDRLNYDLSWKHELITRKEFERRLMISTCRFNPDDWGDMWMDMPKSDEVISNAQTGQGVISSASTTKVAHNKPDEPQTYHLNCVKCGKPYQSVDAFPSPQVCPDCRIRADERAKIELWLMKATVPEICKWLNTIRGKIPKPPARPSAVFGYSDVD